MEKNWEYYNHALVPTSAPHEEPDTSWMKDGKKWKEMADGKHPLFARWTTDFDCEEETEWWYCIKDAPLDLSTLNSKKRRMVNLGLRYVDVMLIDPQGYAEQLATVNISARIGYGEAIDITEEKKDLVNQFSSYPIPDFCQKIEFLGAFLKETGELIGYGIYEIYSDWVSQSVLKTDPEYHKYHASAALAHFCIERYLNGDKVVRYVSVGARNISHPTNYYDYVMTYFGYRKAYCKLHIQYISWVKIIVGMLYPFRNILQKFSKNKQIYQVWCVLRQEEIHRTFK